MLTFCDTKLKITCERISFNYNVQIDAQIWQTESIQCTSRDRSWITRHTNETNWSMAKELVQQNVGWEGRGGGGWGGVSRTYRKNHPEQNTSTATFTERVFMRQILNEACAVIDHEWSTASWRTPSLGSQHGWSNLTKILSLCLSSLSPLPPPHPPPPPPDYKVCPHHVSELVPSESIFHL